MTSSLRSRNNTFSSLELERYGDHRDNADWLAQRLDAASTKFLLLRSDGRALVSVERDALHGLDAGQRNRLALQASPSYLGHADASDHFLLQVDDALGDRIAAELGTTFLDLRSAGLMLPAFDAGLFAYARALANWQERTKFCSRCAAPLRLEAAGHRGKCTNPQCGIEHFPRTDPAIIVIVSYRDACLLGRAASWPQRWYSTLAGFVEPGETLEDAVRREVFEESGVRVGECDYHSSQPWPFPASIMLGFTAQADDPNIHIGHELEDARWFTADQIVADLKSQELLLSPPVSVSFRLIEHWLKQAAGIDLLELVNEGNRVRLSR